MRCEICGKTFKTKRGLAIHKGKIHKSIDKPLLIQIYEKIDELTKLLERQSRSPPIWDVEETTVYGDIPVLKVERSEHQALFDELRNVLKKRGKVE